MWGIDAPESTQLCRGDDSLHRCGAKAANDLDAFTLPADHRPDAGEEFIIDRWPDSRLVVCSACSGHGAKFAPAIGHRLARLATDPSYATESFFSAVPIFRIRLNDRLTAAGPRYFAFAPSDMGMVSRSLRDFASGTSPAMNATDVTITTQKLSSAPQSAAHNSEWILKSQFNGPLLRFT